MPHVWIDSSDVIDDIDTDDLIDELQKRQGPMPNGASVVHVRERVEDALHEIQMGRTSDASRILSDLSFSMLSIERSNARKLQRGEFDRSALSS